MTHAIWHMAMTMGHAGMKVLINTKKVIISILKKWWICYDIKLFVIWLVGVMGC